MQRLSIIPILLLFFKSLLPAQSACSINDLVVTTGECTSNTTYLVTVNFIPVNPTDDQFDLWANGTMFGTYNLSQLPLTIPNFPYNGGANDVVKVCINDNNDCCAIVEFAVPACINTATPCSINDLTVATGECTSNTTYQVTVNFIPVNPTDDQFDLWANGTMFGTYNLSQLPLTIPNFPYNGGANDVVKVCINDNNDCCAIVEFAVPACINTATPCSINDLTVATGDCTSNTTYQITVNFIPVNPTDDQFNLWANGVPFGTYNLSQLPLTIPNFPYNGGANDVVKVCINDNSNCCNILEFAVPPCINNSSPCEIYDLTVTTGNCTGDSTYVATINFQVASPTDDQFDLWVNGTYYNTYNLSQLPLTIEHFPWNGGAFDGIKVCINDNSGCCKVKEFEVPACLNGSDCNLYDLVVDTGDCIGDSAYVAIINFQVTNPTAQHYTVWVNGQFQGVHPITEVPLTLIIVPDNGPNDWIKVCITENPNCCDVVEYPVPPCIGQENCHIYDMTVITTPCICGQFFALVSFEYENGGNGGFDITGNGQNYGNYPYATNQPIILGPLMGDPNMGFEFIVRDHNHPDCHDFVETGVVACGPDAAQESPDAGVLAIIPNPATDMVYMKCTGSQGNLTGSGDARILDQTGKLITSFVVANLGSFSYSVADLPAGSYQIVVQTDSGVWQGKVVKVK